MLPTAYYHQIPDGNNIKANNELKEGQFLQHTYDLFNHTGTSPENKKYDYEFQYPQTLKQLQQNIDTGHLIGIGHYVTVKGMQIIRVFWLSLAIGIFLFVFLWNKPLIFSLLSSSIVPPLANVFISETDPRHLVMSSPIQIVAGCIIIYYVIDLLFLNRVNKNAG